jgi:hypothetical protein
MNETEKILKELIAEVVSEILDTPKKQPINEVIRKKGKKWCLHSKKKTKGKSKNLGCYNSKEGAEKREQQVNFFKHKK